MFYYVSDDWGECPSREVDEYKGGDDPEYFKAYLDYVKQTLMPLIMNPDYELWQAGDGDEKARKECYKHFSDWLAEIEDPNPTDSQFIEKYEAGHIGLVFEMLHMKLQLKMPDPIDDENTLPLDLSNHKPTKITD